MYKDTETHYVYIDEETHYMCVVNVHWQRNSFICVRNACLKGHLPHVCGKFVFVLKLTTCFKQRY